MQGSHLRLQVRSGVGKKIARIFSDSGFGVAGARHVRYGKLESQCENAENMPKARVNAVLDKTILSLIQVVQPDCDSQASHRLGANAGFITEILIS
jgi:hypothetical protein